MARVRGVYTLWDGIESLGTSQQVSVYIIIRYKGRDLYKNLQRVTRLITVTHAFRYLVTWSVHLLASTCVIRN